MFLRMVFTGLAVTALAVAQAGIGVGGVGGGRAGEDGGAPTGGGGGMRPQKATKADQMIGRLKLNSDQKSEFITIMQSTLKDAAPVIQQVVQSRNTLATALINGKSGAEIEPLVKAMSDAQFQMTGVEVMTFKRVVAILKPNQMTKAPEAFDLMADMFLPVSSGPGGPGGPGGRGEGGEGGGGRGSRGGR